MLILKSTHESILSLQQSRNEALSRELIGERAKVARLEQERDTARLELEVLKQKLRQLVETEPSVSECEVSSGCEDYFTQGLQEEELPPI